MEPREGETRAVHMERFWNKVDKSSDCWIWQGAKDSSGYGNIKICGKTARSHRVVWQLSKGKIPENMCVLHKCDNRLCVNPDHLFLGTKADNMQDMKQKGRGRGGELRGEQHGSSKLTEANVRHIRMMYNRRHNDLTMKEVGAMFGISATTVFRIVNRHTWKHVN